MRTILVTGGAGFIGSNFVQFLYNRYPDYRILVLDALTYAGSIENLPEGALGSDRYEFWYGDVRNGELINSLVSRADVVVHMAAESHVTRSIYDNKLFFLRRMSLEHKQLPTLSQTTETVWNCSFICLRRKSTEQRYRSIWMRTIRLIL